MAFKRYGPKQYIPFIFLIIMMWLLSGVSNYFTFWILSKFLPKLPIGIGLGIWLPINIVLGYLVIVKLGHKLTKIEENELKQIFYGLTILILLSILFILIFSF